nr:MAG TPA: IDEAL domain [Bacteriophage sp.]
MQYSIYFNQIQQLTNELNEALAKKDVKLFDEILNEREEIIEQLENFTIENGDDLNKTYEKIEKIIK